MKKMFKIKQIGACAGMAALMMAGAWLSAACSSDEAIVENKPVIGENTTPTETTVKFTATLAPKNDASGTRVITLGKDANNKDILNVAWKKDEEIAVRYESTSTFGNNSEIAKVTHVDETTGVATIEAENPLYHPKDGGSVTFVYPASLVNSTGDDIDADKLLNQHGNLMARTTPNASVDDISTYFDAATGSGTLNVSAGQAVVSSKVTMKNEVCICKFKFTLDNGTSGGTSIGGSQQREFNNLKIYDGNGHVYTITSDRPHDYTTGTRGFKENEEIYVAMLPVSSKTVIFHYEQTVTGGKANYIKYAPSTTLAAGKFYRSLNLTLTKDDYNGVHNFKDLSKGSSIIAADGDVIYQSSNEATSHTITIPDGITVTLAGVNISAAGSSGIICNGTANINLVGTNSVTSTAINYPAIRPGGSGKTLTISGNGSLTATGGKYAAGIGSGANGTCGAIIINGGTVTAKGGMNAAGIGSGDNGSCGYITISGGTVNATGGYYGAGIGSGYYKSSCGGITINGGSITANGGYYGAGIGSGYYISSCGGITINGGSITATGGNLGAGIGSGSDGKYTSISIVSGITRVKATKGSVEGAPIGKGNHDQNSGSVTVDGVENWTGAGTTNLKFEVSTTTYTNDTWTLTPKN